MKYIYYIIGILILITIGLAVRLSGFKVEVSEPALVVNDRIISKSELDEFAKVGSYHSRGKGFLDSVITRQLLIQEAVKQGIHKEESFRKMVEAFYEQSLVKTLIDRKFQTLSPVVTEQMMEKYKEMCRASVKYTKFVYDNEDAFQNGRADSATEQVHAFENLSEALKFSLFLLTPGETTKPELSDEGYVVYRLDEIVDSPGGAIPEDNQVRDFLVDQSKNAMFDAWLSDIRKAADIRNLSDE